MLLRRIPYPVEDTGDLGQGWNAVTKRYGDGGVLLACADLYRSPRVPGATPEAVADAHRLDVAIQKKHGVRYHTYWFDRDHGLVFCLAEGPSREAVEAVHQRVHRPGSGHHFGARWNCTDQCFSRICAGPSRRRRLYRLGDASNRVY